MSKEVSVTGMKYRSAKLWEMIMAPACAGNNICMYMRLWVLSSPYPEFWMQ